MRAARTCLIALAGLLGAGAAAASLCATTALRPPGDARIASAVAEARRQHALFGGQTIERNGGLFRVGHHEAETARNRGETVPTWERVAGFWRALAREGPPELATGAGILPLAQVQREAGATSAGAALAVREALLRTALVDSPWSAAFLSYLLRTAGFGPTEFAFSDSHVDYVQAAFAASAAEAAGQATGYAFRACDVARTRPRAGDLLCATRAGTAAITGFAALQAALAARAPGAAFPMHCDLVVRADAGGDGKIETIGGNVVQSVTLTRMTLNADKLLGRAYFSGAPSPRGHLGRRPWVVLLQARG